MINYKILRIFPDECAMDVEYWTDDDAIHNTIHVILPLPAPSGDQLHEFIMDRLPDQAWCDRASALKNGPADLAHIPLNAEFRRPPRVSRVRSLRIIEV